MTISRFARLLALLIGAIPVSAVLAHPGHQHNNGLPERVLHSLETEWGPILLLAAIGIGGIVFLKKRQSD